MNLATLLSFTTCVVGLLFAALLYAVADAPGMRGGRALAASAAFGSMYAACMTGLTVGSERLSRLGVRFVVLFTSMHLASWLVYSSRREARALYTYEKAMIAVAATFGLAGLVPGALYVTTLTKVDVPWLGVRYLDAEANWRGDLAFVFFMGTLGLLIVRSLRRKRLGADTARGELFGLVALAVTGINDSLVSAGVIELPYVLDIGYLVLVVAVSYELARAFVKNAHELRTAQEELVQKARLAALGEMSAVVAHEVRNPVAIIFNAVATLRKSKEPPEPLFDIVQEEAERLKRMVTDLLEFARPQSLVVVEAEIYPIVEGALEAVRLAMKDVAIAIEVNLPEGLPRVACDERLLRQALINLISNALQAPDRRGAVEVVARVDERAIALAVIDHGRGVSEDVASRIFVPFFTTRPTGTGLGLPVVRRIAEAHGGEVRLVTTPGGGATFEMWLPIAGPKPS